MNAETTPSHQLQDTRIPTHWATKRLGDLVTVHDKFRVPVSERDRQRRRGAYPYCGANGMLDQIDDYLYDGEFVLLAEDGGYWGAFENSAYLMQGRFWVNNHAHVLQANSGTLDNNYFVHALNFMDITPYISGTTRGKLNQGVMLEIPVSVPPLNEQRAIARALNAVQQAKQARQRELALERERKAALMEHLFTHGTRGESTNQTEIGEVPQSWEVHSFGAVAEVKSGQVDPRNEPYASMSHVGPENIESETGRLLPTKSAKELKLISGKYLFTEEDVLYSKIRPYLKKAALPDFTGVCSADMYPLLPKTGIIRRDFLYHYLLTESFTNRAIGFQVRTGIPKINREQLGAIPVPVPSIAEQQEIARVLNALQSKVLTLEHEAKLLSELLDAMLEELMTGRLSAVPLIEEYQQQ